LVATHPRHVYPGTLPFSFHDRVCDNEVEDKSVLDAAIVASARAVEHYEIFRYGTLIAWAEELGHDDIVRFLTSNLNEEKAANTKLNTVRCAKA
jgi:ferritin-like metal-binding protein YciE